MVLLGSRKRNSITTPSPSSIPTKASRYLWATDALIHGKTWPRRSSSLDNNGSNAGKNRVAWSKLLEDCGFQARWISVDQLQQGELESGGIRALILPRTMALSDAGYRASKLGEAWRSKITRALSSVGLSPRIVPIVAGRTVPMIEVLRWQNGSTNWVVVVSNPTRDASVNSAGQADALELAGDLALRFASPHYGGKDLRSGKPFPPQVLRQRSVLMSIRPLC